MVQYNTGNSISTEIQIGLPVLQLHISNSVHHAIQLENYHDYSSSKWQFWSVIGLGLIQHLDVRISKNL